MPPPSRPSRTRPTREQTRERLLAAAEAVFAERGLHVASLEDVALAAGLTKGAVYSNFAGKDELILALMEDRIAARTKAAAAAFAGVAASEPRVGARDAGAALFAAIRADAPWHRLFLEYWARAARDPEAAEHLRDRRRALRHVIAGALERAAAEGGFELPLPAADLAVVLLALSNGLAVEDQIDPGAVGDGLLGDVLARLL